MVDTTLIDINEKTYTKVNVSLGAITIEAIKNDIKIAVASSQPVLTNTAYHLRKAREIIKFEKPSANTWVLATPAEISAASGSNEVIVTEELKTVEISSRGDAGNAVFIQDQTTGTLSLPFLKPETTLSLDADTIVGSNDITLTSGHGLTTISNAGETIEIADTTDGSKFLQCQIITVVGDAITLDCPVNNIYTTTSSTVLHSTSDMNVDGSVTPVVFSLEPLILQKGDMVRVITNILDNAAMDFETFGALPKLINGCVLRVNHGDGTYRIIANFKNNGDLINQAFDHNFATNNGGGTRGLVARLTWGGQSKHGAVIRLDGSLSESLEIVIQDDLTGLLGMKWFGQGSELQE